MTKLLKKFDETKDEKAKGHLATSILQRALNLATKTIINLEIGPLLIIQTNKLSSPHIKMYPQDSTICFASVDEHTINPGQTLSLQLNSLTNYPSSPSDVIYHLDESLPVYFNISLIYTLHFHHFKMINVTSKPIVLPANTLIATAYFPCEHLYLHEVSNKMLQETKTFQHDCMHANMFQTVAKYFVAKAKQSDNNTNLEAPTPDNNAINLESNVFKTDVSPTLPDVSQDQTATGNKEADAGHDQSITAEKVTALNDILCPAQIISQLLQCPSQMKTNQVSSLQRTDLLLNRIIENIQRFPTFCIIKDILYKQRGNNIILALPTSLAKLIVDITHRNISVHLTANQMKKLLKPLIFSFGLDKIIEQTPKECLVCTSTIPRYLKHQVGTQRTSTFLPGEHLVIDSGYMNNSKDQFSKIIILADQCTGRISALPLRNLKSSTVIRMIHLYLCCNVHPKTNLPRLLSWLISAQEE